GELAYDADRLLVRGVDDVRRTLFARKLELLRHAVDGDDRRRTRDPRPATTCRPTPPQPKTATDSPAFTAATLRTAPRPVTTPQPSSADCHRGRPSGSGTAPPAATTARSAKHAVINPCCSAVPSGRRSRLVPSISVPRTAFSPARPQRFGL